MQLRVKKLNGSATLPTRGTEYSAGLDLYADIDMEVTIRPNEMVMIPSNLAMEIPNGYYGALFSRSGLATKKGLVVATGVSVIDADYRGNVGIPIRNLSNEVQTILPQDRIAQLVIQPFATVDICEVSEVKDTERGSGGFGSTNK